MPPRGRPYAYSRKKVRDVVPDRAGIYWLWSFGRLVRIGQSTALQRRLLEYAPKSPNRFRYQTVSEYFTRRSEITRPPMKSAETLLDKIEHTEFEWYKRKEGNLPPWNRYDKHYDVGIFEALLGTFL